MNKAALVPAWDMNRLRHGIALRCVQALSDEQVNAHPIQGMRSARELVVHMYSFLRAATESALAGTVTMDEKSARARVATKADLIAYMEESWRAADAAFQQVTDAQLASPVKAPWGDMPGGIIIAMIPDEFIHHRGQLYCYLRQQGVEPPMVWDFEHNAPGLAPAPRG